MSESAAPRIVIIGCGNMAWHLARKFRDLKCHVHVYNHRANPVLEEMRRKLGATVSTGLHKIDTNAAFYFICVPDRFIGECAKKISPVSPRAVVVHTSGSAELDVLGERGHGTAVFYPLQTFTRSDEVQWHKVPLFIEADSDETAGQVTRLALLFSKQVQLCDHARRLRFHLAAVLVNNFSNALFVAATRIVGGEPGAFGLLLPLAEKTVEKAGKMDPRAAQTGPAKRGDKKTMKKHLKLLEEHPELRKIYRQMSELIVKQQTGTAV